MWFDHPELTLCGRMWKSKHYKYPTPPGDVPFLNCYQLLCRDKNQSLPKVDLKYCIPFMWFSGLGWCSDWREVPFSIHVVHWPGLMLWLTTNLLSPPHYTVPEFSRWPAEATAAVESFSVPSAGTVQWAERDLRGSTTDTAIKSVAWDSWPWPVFCGGSQH